MKENTLSARQMWMNLIVMASLPSFRLLTPMVVKTAGNGTPFSYLLSAALCIPLMLSYGYVAKRQKGKSFHAINRRLFGRFAGWAVSLFYTLWLFFLAAFYLGQYGERINGSLFYDTNTVIFLLLLLFAVSFAVKKGVGTLGRAGSVLSNLILLSLGAFALILLRDVRVENFLPLSQKDVLPTLKGAVPGLAITVFFPLFFVFGESTGVHKPFLPYALKSLGGIAAITALLSALPLGIFGKETFGKLTVPFFAVTRNVVVFDSLERLESLVVATLLTSDFIIVAMLCMAAVEMTGKLFGAKNKSNIIDIIIFGIFIGSMMTMPGEFRLAEWVARFVLPADILFGVLIPLLWLVAARIRKLPQTT